jgi:hypothetical protein
MPGIRSVFLDGADDDAAVRVSREAFLSGLDTCSGGYVETVRRLSPEVSGKGTQWLETVVSRCSRMAWDAVAGTKG